MKIIDKQGMILDGISLLPFLEDKKNYLPILTRPFFVIAKKG